MDNNSPREPARKRRFRTADERCAVEFNLLMQAGTIVRKERF